LLLPEGVAMSVLFVDSFDTYTNLTDKYDSVASGVSISTTARRTGANGMWANTFISSGYVLKNFTSRATYIIGFAINCQSGMGVGVDILTLFDTATPQISLAIDSAGAIKVWRASGTFPTAVLKGTLLGTGSSIITPLNNFHYIEMKVTIHGSTGVIQVVLDGITVLNLTGQNTQNTGNATANQIALGNIDGGTTQIYFDDYYILDSAGAVNNTFLGDISILARPPIANGTLNQYTNFFAAFVVGGTYVVGQQLKDSNNNVQRCTIPGVAGSTPTWATTGGATTTTGAVTFVVIGTGANPGAANWMAVSETPPDDNNSYVLDSTIGDQDRYTYAAVTGSAVKSVIVNMRAEKDDSANRSIRAVCKSGATTADSGADFALLLNSYAIFQGVFDTDPNTGVAWTVANANAAEFGVKTTV